MSKKPLSGLNNAEGEAVCEQNPSYLHTNLTGDNAAQLLKREMPLFIWAAHAAGGTTPSPDPLQVPAFTGDSHCYKTECPVHIK